MSDQIEAVLEAVVGVGSFATGLLALVNGGQSAILASAVPFGFTALLWHNAREHLKG